jgi:UDP-glucose 4-epimerase
MLFERGYYPVVFDLQAKSRPWASPSWPAVTGDINNKWSLDLLFSQWKFDAVIHLAASSEVGASVTDPLRYYQNNVGGTAELGRGKR